MKFLHSFSCACGRIHECPVREVVVGHKAIREVPRLLEGVSHILLVSDANTRPLAIEELSRLLGEAGIRYGEAFFASSEVLIPDEAAIEQITRTLLAGIDKKPYEAVVGIGSGVINDLCKYVSFRHNLPYMIIATAPSMDGFASVGAALILGGMKVTLNARVASWIVGDTRILKDAPLPMIRAGVGDILGKYSCLNDWKLASLVTGEHFCRMIYDMTMKEVLRTRENISGCMERDEKAIGDLMESLVLVGVAMAYMGNSRPASGCEHHFSHFFEITGVAFKEPYLPHGIDVAYSSVLTAELRQMLLKDDPSVFSYHFDEDVWREDVRKVYKGLAPEVIALQEKAGIYQKDLLPQILENWPKIRRILSEAPSPEEILSLLESAGYRMDSFLSFYGEEKIRTCMIWAKELKNRYTLLWLLQNCGRLSSYARQLNLSIYKQPHTGVE